MHLQKQENKKSFMKVFGEQEHNCCWVYNGCPRLPEPPTGCSPLSLSYRQEWATRLKEGRIPPLGSSQAERARRLSPLASDWATPLVVVASQFQLRLDPRARKSYTWLGLRG